MQRTIALTLSPLVDQTLTTPETWGVREVSDCSSISFCTSEMSLKAALLLLGRSVRRGGVTSQHGVLTSTVLSAQGGPSETLRFQQVYPFLLRELHNASSTPTVNSQTLQTPGQALASKVLQARSRCR